MWDLLFKSINTPGLNLAGFLDSAENFLEGLISPLRHISFEGFRNSLTQLMDHPLVIGALTVSTCGLFLIWYCCRCCPASYGSARLEVNTAVGGVGANAYLGRRDNSVNTQLIAMGSDIKNLHTVISNNNGTNGQFHQQVNQFHQQVYSRFDAIDKTLKGFETSISSTQGDLTQMKTDVLYIHNAVKAASEQAEKPEEPTTYTQYSSSTSSWQRRRPGRTGSDSD